MRTALLLLVGAAALCGPLPAEAARLPAPGTEIAMSPNIVLVDKRCGHDRHYVPRHRSKSGKMIRGHCVADRHR